MLNKCTFLRLFRDIKKSAVLFSLLAVFLIPCSADAHPIWFNTSMSYSDTQPGTDDEDIFNRQAAAFDANNIGGSGVNADGGDNNGTANDATTYVANNQPVQGQTFVTGGASYGYDLNSITVRMPGYTNNNASGENHTYWDLTRHNGPVIVTVSEVDGSSVLTKYKRNFIAGQAGNPGAGNSANGAGVYITFEFPSAVHLQPNTEYAFDFQIGNGSSNFFEWLGTREDAYPGGTAYTRSGNSITRLEGDRVFMLDISTSESEYQPFVHPGTLHTQADLDRMTAKVNAGEQPWAAGYDVLMDSPYNNLGWPAYDVDYIKRGTSSDNYTRCQQDAQLIYTLTLIWHLTGDTDYADRAVEIANVWSDLIGLQGNSNRSLAAGICGYLFAISGDLLSTYPGWADADEQAYKDMMMRVFYPENFDFLWRHHDTFWRTGGNTHYRLNWDAANMASMAAIGILCDNRAVYEQALDYFKYGPGNGRIERAAWYIHPNGMAQTEEMGRDQGHNLFGWHCMARLCQIAWNQGDDIYGYDNNRVLRALEYITKYNLFNDVNSVYHRNCDLNYTERVSEWGRGNLIPMYEMVYNHYVNIKGLAAPYCKAAAEQIRPEPYPDTGIHPSQVDWFGLGTLTYTREPVDEGAVPSGLQASWSEDKIVLDWWGSANAKSYNVKRSTTTGEPYTVIAATGEMKTWFADTDVSDDNTYYYVVSANTSGGESADSEPLRVSRELVTHYTFEGNCDDVVGNSNGVLKGGSTGLPEYASGFGDGQAVKLDGEDDFVKLPKGIANHRDITIAAWVYWNGGGAWQRIFDFGTEIEKNMFLTPSNGSNMQFSITTSRGYEGSANLYGETLPTDEWVHVAVTIEADTGTLYVNGEPVDSKTIDMIDPLFGQVYCYLGRSLWNPDPLFDGKIDDFRIYNYAISRAEIASLAGTATDMQKLSILTEYWLWAREDYQRKTGWIEAAANGNDRINFLDFAAMFGE